MDKTEEPSRPDGEIEKLGERDSIIIQFFSITILSASILYALIYSDVYVASLGLMPLIVLYAYTHESPEVFMCPIRRRINPIEEASIVLLLFIGWVTVFSVLVVGYGDLAQVGGILLFGIGIPYLFLARGCGYDKGEFGLRKEKSRDAWWLFFAGLASICLGAFLKIAANPSRLDSLGNFNILMALASFVVIQWLVIGPSEEVVFRAVLQPRMAQCFRSRVIGLCMASSMFAGMHIFMVFLGSSPYPGDLAFAFLYALLTRLSLAMILGILWEHSESILLPWMLHASNNSVFGLLLFLELL